MAAGSDDDILLAGGAEAIGHRCGVTAGGKRDLPQLFSGFGVETAEKAIRRASDEDQTAGRDHRAAKANGTGRYLLRMGAAKILHGAKRHLPANLSFRHVHRREHSPGRRAARKIRRRLNKPAIKTVRRAELVAVIAVFGSWPPGLLEGKCLGSERRRP